jgi:hypothetical protein
MASVHPFFVAATPQTRNTACRGQYALDFAIADLPYHEEYLSLTELSSVTGYGLSPLESQ